MSANLAPHFSVESAVRPNILALHPYRCARDDYSEGILLDANENALGHSIIASKSIDPSEAAIDSTLALPLHRYPSPTHVPIKERIADLRSLPSPDHIFLGVGSDEVLDLLIRILVKPGTEGNGQEKILVTPPTYGMYGVCAQVNDVGVVKVPLRLEPEPLAAPAEGGSSGRFSLDVPAVKRAIQHEQNVLGNRIKLIFLCSPGNPTGTLLDLNAVEELLRWEEFKGVVIVDEAYIDFVSGDEEEGEERDVERAALKKSAVQLVERYPNLVVSQTMSKGFGLAGIRVGIALAQPPIIQILNNTKAPYSVSVPTAHLALQALSPESLAVWRENVRELKRNRTWVIDELVKLRNGKELGVGPIIGSSDANFVLVRILERPTTKGADEGRPDSARAQKVYKMLAEELGVVVRFRGSEMGCEGCLRITVGTVEENKVMIEKLVDALKKI